MSRRKQHNPTRPGARDSGGERPAPGPRSRHGGKPHKAGGHGAGDTYLYGFHAVLAALANPERDPERLIMTRNAEAELARQGLRPNLQPEIMDGEALSALLPAGAVHQGIALKTSPLPNLDVFDACEGASRVVVLDQVTDPHNFGAILRSAAVFGAEALVTTERNSPALGGALAKAASGGLEKVKIARIANLVRGIEELKELGFEVIGLDGEGEMSLPEMKLSPKVALVLGAEGAGLRRLTREHCDLLARLPAAGDMKSLNVSNAAAVALYELFRRG
ncbi:MAG: 23S rRNA (guanosine(2251)-2'-O)-methyltransferase RlmB [Alphaproteobacteria bacterium]|nr:23S rRNA (guanosine(2251)-2'-O)-methyltransferase RlmB [Alphaproteobacteria bacterium]MDX5415361.1 23S rRNA (guanosine(2251)-2'-O)-methyltransferase RlmB [Alphaproteobacteria bacterium]MDX5492576.1 23S rRNA (guanosine(2251)-2'-O)-methyltransferase RlmB [Alphaproteobacteria bacterium]